MAKLKLGPIQDDKPVRLTLELPAALHRDLIAYAEVLAHETTQRPIEPTKLIAPIRGSAPRRWLWTRSAELGLRLWFGQPRSFCLRVRTDGHTPYCLVHSAYVCKTRSPARSMFRWLVDAKLA